jgi:hypothetical protein
LLSSEAGTVTSFFNPSATPGFHSVQLHDSENFFLPRSRTPLHVLTYAMSRYLLPVRARIGAPPPPIPAPATWKPWNRTTAPASGLLFMGVVTTYATCGRGSGGARRQWRLLNSGLRIRRRWRFESAVHATAVRAGTRARMLPTTSSHMPAPDDAPSASALFALFIGAGAMDAAVSRCRCSPISSSSPALFLSILSCGSQDR